ncbi:MAG TPA: LLM class flavin-dependent oxidoreductase [Geobacterales bacterium]|nr:LLM class flavin-dependent oxidoreductase [Geobacterales bacterium]
MSRNVFFAIQLWGHEIDRVFKEIEDLGYDAAYYGDGPFDWLLDCYSVLGYAIALTNRIKLGPAVTYLEGSYRHPVAVMKALFTLARISKGRFEARLGFIRNEAEQFWSKYGIRIKDMEERIKNFEEAVKMVREIMEKGKSKAANVEISNFVPVAKFPICIAAMGKKTIPIALKYADIWELSYVTPEKLRELLDRYKKANIEISIELDVIIAKDHESFRRKYSEYLNMRSSKAEESFRLSAIAGTPDQCIKKIQQYLDLGIKRFTLAFNEYPAMDGIEVFSREVLPSF